MNPRPTEPPRSRHDEHGRTDHRVGVAAAALASRLLQDDPQRDILIIEAGTRVKMQDQALWDDFMVSGNAYAKLPYYKYNDLAYPERDAPAKTAMSGRRWCRWPVPE